MFLAPVKKSKAYVSEIRTKHGKPFVITVNHVHIQDVFHIKEGEGYVLHIGIPNDSIAYDTIRTLDEQALHETMKKNTKWFKNALTKDKIIDYFRPSFAPQSTSLTVLISDSKDPIHVEWYGEYVESFEKLVSKGKKELRKTPTSFVIQAIGLYFYEQKFGIRWKVRSISFGQKPSNHENEHVVDKDEIEHFWNDEVTLVCDSMMKDIQVFEDKIEKLKDEMRGFKDLFETAKNMENADSAWNECLEELRDRVAKYRSGML